MFGLAQDIMKVISSPTFVGYVALELSVAFTTLVSVSVPVDSEMVMSSDVFDVPSEYPSFGMISHFH